MSWETVKPGDIGNDVLTQATNPPPEGEYVFRTLGATINDYDRLVITTAINEGEQAGRKVFVDLPAPKSNNDWPVIELKRLEVALGIAAYPGETYVNYFNRVATNGHGLFAGRLYHNTYTAKDNTEKTNAKLAFRTVRPAV